MNPLKEIKKLHKENLQLRQMKRELEDELKGQGQEEQKEPTLHFADIKEISEEELNETTTTTFQRGIWLILQHNKEWMKKVSSNNNQHPKDIEVDKAIIEAEFRDDKILKKMITQLTEVKTAPYFQQIGPLAMILEMYMRKGYYNASLQAYVNMGEVTNANTHEMLVKALEKARKEVDAEVMNIPEMDSQEAQDTWWQMILSTMSKEDENIKPIIMMKVNLMIEKWEQHLKNEIEFVGLRRQLRITKAVIQLNK